MSFVGDEDERPDYISPSRVEGKNFWRGTEENFSRKAERPLSGLTNLWYFSLVEKGNKYGLWNRLVREYPGTERGRRPPDHGDFMGREVMLMTVAETIMLFALIVQVVHVAVILLSQKK